MYINDSESSKIINQKSKIINDMKPFKSLSIICLLACFCVAMNAQDVITKKNGDEIQAKVLEVGVSDVKYKRYGSDSGPTYTLPKSDIFMIKYENGDKDVFENKDNAKTSNTTPTASTPTATPATQSAVSNQSTNQVKAEQINFSRTKSSSSDFRKGHVGLAVGGAFLTEDYYNVDAGIQVNLTFGYLFGKNIGITSTIFGTSFNVSDTKYSDASIGLTGMMAGPLFSVATGSGIVEFDGKPMIGFGIGTVTAGSQSDTSDEVGFVFGLGGSVRWNCAKRISISGNFDYYNCTIDEVDLSSIGIGIGVNFRF